MIVRIWRTGYPVLVGRAWLVGVVGCDRAVECDEERSHYCAEDHLPVAVLPRGGVRHVLKIVIHVQVVV